MTNQPRIFISYSRKDGAAYAAALRDALARRGFALWQDVVAMHGGRNWKLQIYEAIEGADVMVLVITQRGALESPVVRDEWMHAQTAGTPLLPIPPDDDVFRHAPRWVGKVDNFILPQDRIGDEAHLTWTRFLGQLTNPPPRQPHLFTAPRLPEHFVPREHETEQVMARLLDEQRQNPVSAITAMRGGGGFGKNTLAIALCNDNRVRQVYDEGVLWLTFGESALARDKLNEVLRMLDPASPQHTEINPAV